MDGLSFMDRIAIPVLETRTSANLLSLSHVFCCFFQIVPTQQYYTVLPKSTIVISVGTAVHRCPAALLPCPY